MKETFTEQIYWLWADFEDYFSLIKGSRLAVHGRQYRVGPVNFPSQYEYVLEIKGNIVMFFFFLEIDPLIMWVFCLN